MQIGCVFCIAASAYATPVSLEEAVVIGSGNHALAKIQESKREVTRLLLREKWREYLPKLGVNYFTIRNLNQNQSDSLYQDVRFTVNQLVYDGGENERTMEIAKLASLLNEEDYRAALYKLRLEIRSRPKICREL